jgi:hypothetical protein
MDSLKVITAIEKIRQKMEWPKIIPALGTPGVFADAGYPNS